MVSDKDFEQIQGLEGGLEEEAERRPGEVVDDRDATGDVKDEDDEKSGDELSLEEEKELRATGGTAEVDDEDEE